MKNNAPLRFVNASSRALDVDGGTHTYLSGNCQGEAVHKHHVVRDLEVRNLAEEKHIEHTGRCFRSRSEAIPHLALTEAFYLLWTGCLAALQSDAGAHLLPHPLVFHTNHLRKKERTEETRRFCLRSRALIQFELAVLPGDSLARGRVNFDLWPTSSRRRPFLRCSTTSQEKNRYSMMEYTENIHECQWI